MKSLKYKNMKKLSVLILAVSATILMSCQSGRNAENNENAKDPDKNMMLMEDAKVEEEKDEGDYRGGGDSRRDTSGSIRDTLNR
jgi:hypothetical protein